MSLLFTFTFFKVVLASPQNVVLVIHKQFTINALLLLFALYDVLFIRTFQVFIESDSALAQLADLDVL